MSQAALTDTVKELCLELGIHDPQALGAAVRKLKRVVAAVPPLEDFVKRVCDIAGAHVGMGLSRGVVGGDGVGGAQYLESVLGVVLQWAHGTTERSSSSVRATVPRDGSSSFYCFFALPSLMLL
jgi:hypothetical protein